MALALALMVAVVAGAADKGEDDAAWRHCLGLTGELTSSDTWQLEASYQWFPVRYAVRCASVASMSRRFVTRAGAEESSRAV